MMRSLPTFSRRQLVKLGAVAGLPQLGAQAQTAPSVEPLRSVFLMDLIAETAAAIPAGSRNIVPVLNGTFEGPRLKGTITGPGGDWTTRRPDGVTILDVRLILQTDDNQRIYVTYRGVVYRPPQQPAAGGGSAAAAAPTYFRITPVFETTSSKYDWLNRIVAVGSAFTVPGSVMGYDLMGSGRNWNVRATWRRQWFMREGENR